MISFFKLYRYSILSFFWSSVVETCFLLRFEVLLDRSQPQYACDAVELVCQLQDKHLPAVPHLRHLLKFTMPTVQFRFFGTWAENAVQLKQSILDLFWFRCYNKFEYNRCSCLGEVQRILNKSRKTRHLKLHTQKISAQSVERLRSCRYNKFWVKSAHLFRSSYAKTK